MSAHFGQSGNQLGWPESPSRGQEVAPARADSSALGWPSEVSRETTVRHGPVDSSPDSRSDRGSATDSAACASTTIPASTSTSTVTSAHSASVVASNPDGVSAAAGATGLDVDGVDESFAVDLAATSQAEESVARETHDSAVDADAGNVGSLDAAQVRAAESETASGDVVPSHLGSALAGGSAEMASDSGSFEEPAGELSNPREVTIKDPMTFEADTVGGVDAARVSPADEQGIGGTGDASSRARPRGELEVAESQQVEQGDSAPSEGMSSVESRVVAQSTSSGGAPERSTVSRETGIDAETETVADPAAGGLVDADLSSSAGDVSRETPMRQAHRASAPLPTPEKTRVLTVANQKGGVGKTTTAVNLAAALAQAGLHVLVLDCDPQGNASTALGIPHSADTPSLYDVLVDSEPLEKVVAACPDIDGLYCAPATIHLAGAEIELVPMVAREMRLSRALEEYLEARANRGEPRLDYVLIDCPPSLGLLTVNAFVAGTEVLIPIQCEYYALEGLSQLLNNIQLIRRHLNPDLHVSTILLTMYDGRTRLAAQVADEVRQHFADTVLSSTVPRSVRISEAPSHAQTVITYDPSSSGALSYMSAAREIAERVGAASQ